LELQLERVDLTAVVQEVVGRFREELAREQVDVSVRLGQGLLGLWDKSRVDQIVTNLLSNAIKYGNHQPVEITAVANDNAIELRVVDNGIGIPGSNPERIFQRFERAGNARSFGGMGLGLYIVNQLVEAHGGIISVKTEEGRGTTFAVVLPKNLEPSPGFHPQPTA
jgi:signal transduction histidine kinase